MTLQDLRRISEARAECDRGLALAPGNFDLVRVKVMTYLQEGDLVGARAVLAAAPKEVGPTDLVAYFGTMWDLDWVLDDAQLADRPEVPTFTTSSSGSTSSAVATKRRSTSSSPC